MARKFKFPEMACKLGTKVNSEGAGEGEKREDLISFSLVGLMLPASSLDKILGKGAHERLFTKDANGGVVPAFGDDVNEIKLVHRYVDSTVTLALDGETLTLAQAKIMKVILQPQIGGMTWMSCEVEAPATEGVDNIRTHADLKIAAQLAFGLKPVLDKRQRSLPLNEGNDDAEDEADEKPRGGRKGNGSTVHA